MQNLIIAAGVGIGVGANAAIAKNLGAKDQEAADRSADTWQSLTWTRRRGRADRRVTDSFRE